nr:MAG TPA: hypothetical protein [Herelleviridae sp.]
MSYMKRGKIFQQPVRLKKDSADYQIRLLKGAVDNLNKFIYIHREALNKSIVQACKCYGQTAPEWFTSK